MIDHFATIRCRYSKFGVLGVPSSEDANESTEILDFREGTPGFSSSVPGVPKSGLHASAPSDQGTLGTSVTNSRVLDAGAEDSNRSPCISGVGTPEQAEHRKINEYKTTRIERVQPGAIRSRVPNSRNPLIPPEVRAKIEAIELHARSKGWPVELLYNANFWDWPRGLAALLDAADEIGEVTCDYIEILKVRPDVLRFRRHIG
jgi:hypothetical protein